MFAKAKEVAEAAQAAAKSAAASASEAAQSAAASASEAAKSAGASASEAAKSVGASASASAKDRGVRALHKILEDLEALNNILVDAKCEVSGTRLQMATTPSVSVTVRRRPDSDLSVLRAAVNDKSNPKGVRAACSAVVTAASMDAILGQHRMQQEYTEISLSAGLTGSSVTAGLTFDQRAMAAAREPTNQKPPPPPDAAGNGSVVVDVTEDIEIVEYS